MLLYLWGDFIFDQKEVKLDKVRFLNLIKENQINIVDMVPSAMKELLLDVDKPKSVQVLISGGERLEEGLKDQLINKGYELYNHYGPTETTVDAIVSKCSVSNKVVLGKPRSNVRCYILDSQNHVVPIGVIGEICIAGDCLARGYLNRPDLTEESFIVSPVQIPEKRIYKTGDLGRWLADGTIEFIGRVDSQIKIRGFRVELGEIENQLAGHEKVRDAAVIAKEDGAGHKYLCAYVVLNAEISMSDLRRDLAMKLPDYMIPAYFMVLDQMPLTSNGKIDVNALSEINGDLIRSSEYVAPRNEIEEKLATIWSELLGIEKVGIDDNFYELGGHSLKATAFIAKTFKECNIEIPLRQMFKTPTIRELTEFIRIHMDTSVESSYTTIEAAEEREYYPVSSAQKRLFILDQLKEESTSYNIPQVVILKGELDRERFEYVFKALIQRHESLRTSFEFIDDQPLQKIHSNVEFKIHYLEAKEEEVEQIIEEFIRPFDLGQAPLLRIALVKVDTDHILLTDMHHIISDGISTNVLIKEFCQYYAGEAVSELRIQYKDFAVWQNKLFTSEQMQKQEDYWLKVFADEVPVLDLPTDFTRPLVMNNEGKSIDFKLGREWTSKVKELTAETGTTQFMVLLAIYNVLLSRYSSQEDIVVGTPIAGRNHADLDNIIGMFVNTLALRNYPSGSKTFIEFLSEVKENALKAYENQDYQFEMLVEKLNLSRDVSRNPLFDTMLVLQNMDQVEMEVNGLQVLPYQHEANTVKFDLVINVGERDEEIYFIISYRTDLVNDETMVRFADHFARLFTEIMQNPGQQIMDYEFISDVEKKELIYDFNDTKVDYPEQKLIHQFFEEQVERTPEQIALLFEDQQLTYRELNEKTNQLARVLRTKGVCADQIVGIRVERSMEMMLGILAILKAGGAYLPIDIHYPMERVEYTLTDSETQILLTKGDLSELTHFTGEIIDLTDVELFTGDCSNLEIINRSINLAYVLYTSGSTGQPKGVMVEHHSLVNTLTHLQRKYPLEQSDTILQSTVYTFDASVREILWWFINGAKCCLLAQDDEKDPQKIVQAIEKHQITLVKFVPILLNEVLKMIEELSQDKVSSLKYIMVGGEALSRDVVSRFYQIFDREQILVNVYGPTEATIHCSEYEVTGPVNEAVVPIGKPISNNRIVILDQNRKLQPVGVVGELCVTGANVSRGYVNKPDLMVDKFVINPYSTKADEYQMYRTGDLARWLSDGTIEYIGRLDHQVKIRGYRIELGEIENQLLQIEGIQETVVIARDDQNGNKYLCAYITDNKELVITDNKELVITDIRASLAKELPDYMIPAYFVRLDKMPLTSNGKLDRKALPKPDGSIQVGTEYVAPTNVIEESLTRIWSEILGLEAETIGIDANFFELGGHSLKATSMTANIHKTFDVEIPLREVFKTPTIRELAVLIEIADKALYSSIVKVEEREFYPLSSAQGRLFILDQLEQNKTNYNIPKAIIIEGELDVERLENAFKNLIERHESLRTSFMMVAEEPVQRIEREVEFNVQRLEFQSAGLDVDEQIPGLINEFVKPFDLSKAPLLRVGLAPFVGDENRYLMIFDIHHIISDGVSMSLLVSDLINLYEENEIPELNIQYKDFAVWQKDLFSSEKITKLEEYWLKVFDTDEEIPVLNLPTDYIRPAVMNFAGDQITFSIERELTENLNRLVKETGTTLYMVLLAAYNILLTRYSGQEDIIVGSPIAGRPYPDLESIIGMFVNTLAMRNNPVSEKAFNEFLDEVKTNALSAYENQDYQFEMLIEKLNLERNLSRNALFDTMFALQNIADNEINLSDLRFKPYEFSGRISKFDLSLYASETEKGIGFAFEYSTNLFKKSTIERMAGHFVNILQEIGENPEIQIADIEMISFEEKAELLFGFNNTKANYQEDKTLHQLFEEQVENSSEKTALIQAEQLDFEDQQMTYRELNQRSNQIGLLLRQKGVKPDQIVGIMVDRSFEMLIGIMGILKAGGAYLPIDPDYPQDRIAYMLEDSKTNLLLTQQHLETVEFYKEQLDEVIYLDDQTLYQGECGNLKPVTRTDNLAYIIYTSGSTGRPKGVMIEHRSSVNVLQYLHKTYPLTQEDSYLLKTAYTFDVSVTEIFGWFLGNGRLVIPVKGTEKDPKALVKVIDENNVTHINFVPSMLNIVINTLSDETIRLMNRLKYIFVAGEAISKPLVAKVFELLPDVIFENIYGPTEATIYATRYSLGDLGEEVNVPIGKPLQNIQTYILSDQGKPQPIGVQGELYIAGDCLARGYF